ncbi:MAG: hypothetical protein M1130_07210 [Actinobacteria bacterium]|nr:hypothetical protein [Actinomycetota bacterium]
MKWLGILFMAVLLAVAPIYGNAQQTKEKAIPPTQPQTQVEKGKQAQAGKTYTQKERENYEKQTATEWAENQQKIDALKTKQETAPVQMRRMILKGLVRLQRGIFTGQKQLAAMEKAPADTWSGMRADMDKAKEGWNKEYESFVARLK